MPDKQIKVLELFAGKRSVGTAFEAKGHIVFSVDWDRDFPDIDLYADIGKLQAQEILDRFGKPDVVWASPDCTSYVVDLPDVDGKTMLVLRGGLDTWRYVRESYDEIKMTLTDRLIAVLPAKGEC